MERPDELSDQDPVAEATAAKPITPGVARAAGAASVVLLVAALITAPLLRHHGSARMAETVRQTSERVSASRRNLVKKFMGTH